MENFFKWNKRNFHLQHIITFSLPSHELLLTRTNIVNKKIERQQQQNPLTSTNNNPFFKRHKKLQKQFETNFPFVKKEEKKIE